jgi:hypothetical protein
MAEQDKTTYPATPSTGASVTESPSTEAFHQQLLLRIGELAAIIPSSTSFESAKIAQEITRLEAEARAFAAAHKRHLELLEAAREGPLVVTKEDLQKLGIKPLGEA